MSETVLVGVDVAKRLESAAGVAVSESTYVFGVPVKTSRLVGKDQVLVVNGEAIRNVVDMKLTFDDSALRKGMRDLQKNVESAVKAMVDAERGFAKASLRLAAMWGPRRVDVTRSKPRADAAEWLTRYLASGPRTPLQVRTDAMRLGIHDLQLARAAEDMGVVKTPATTAAKASWRLPAELHELLPTDACPTCGISAHWLERMHPANVEAIQSCPHPFHEAAA